MHWLNEIAARIPLQGLRIDFASEVLIL